MSFVLDLYRYWQQEPPVHDVARAWVGYKPPTGESSRSSPAEMRKNLTPTDIAFEMATKQQGIKTMDNLPLPVQDWLSKLSKQKGRNN